MLSLHMSELGVGAMPSVAELAKHCALGDSTVRAALAAMHEAGWVVRQVGGGAETNTYQATIPEAFTPPGAGGVPQQQLAGSPAGAGGVSRAGDSLPGEEPQTSRVATPSASPPAAAPRQTAADLKAAVLRLVGRSGSRDLLWEVMAELLGTPSNDGEQGKRGRALKLVRQSMLGLHPEVANDPEACAGLLRERIGLALQHWGSRGITVTDMAVANNWQQLDRAAHPNGSGLTAEDIMAQAVAEGLQL